MENACEVYFNPSCSKCQKVRTLLEGEGITPTYREYLTVAPSRAELERLMALLGTDDPRTMMRIGERLYEELGLASASRDALLEAMAQHPSLLERPIVIVGDRAVIARPPEKVEELLRR